MNILINMDDPRVRRTHRLLTESFTKLLTIKSYDSISVTDITKEADVNRATFYSHFSDKDELFEEIIYHKLYHSMEPTFRKLDAINEEMIRSITISLYQCIQDIEANCSKYNEATKLLVEHRMKKALSEFMYYKLKKHYKLDIDENVLKVNATMIGNAICSATCMGQYTKIELVMDEICYMVLPQLSHLNKR